MDNFQKDFMEFITNNWWLAGYFSTFFLSIIITRNVLKKQGYVTVGDIFIGALLMGLCVVAGWLSLIFLGYMLKEHFEEFFKNLFQVKIFQTTEYKTKNLLYKGEEDDE